MYQKLFRPGTGTVPGLEPTGCRNGPRAGLLAGGFALLFACGFALDAQALERSDQASSVTVASIASPERVRHPREKTFMKRKWGVEVVFVRQVAAGYMLEFRYKVLDAKKAQPLFERQTKPILTHTASGAKFVVPTPAKTGALRNSNLPQAGRTYWMFFANPGKFIKPGEQVNIEIGDFVAESLVVQ
jgi:hypothetical protein